MSCDFSIKTTDLSQDAFELREYVAGDDPLCTINQAPSQTLKGGHGVETLAWTQTGSSIASGAEITVQWSTPKGRSFGVRIYAPLQVGPFGYAPYYQIKVDDGDWDGERHGDSYTFDKDLLGYNIEVKPMATHSHLYVDINITDSE